MTPPSASLSIYLGSKLLSGLTLGIDYSLPVAHLLCSSFLNLGHLLHKDVLQTMCLLQKCWIQCNSEHYICVLPMLTHFLPIHSTWHCHGLSLLSLICCCLFVYCFFFWGGKGVVCGFFLLLLAGRDSGTKNSSPLCNLTQYFVLLRRYSELYYIVHCSLEVAVGQSE